MDESLRADIDNELYYYPTLNIKYPKNPGNYIRPGRPYNVLDLDSDSRFQDLGLMDRIFDGNNMYVFRLDGGMEIANNIGHVDIPVMFNDEECCLAYEDYYDGGDDGVVNCNRYDVVDPRTL